MTQHPRLVAGAAVALAFVGGCGSAERREAERVLGVIEHLRGAEANERAEVLARLEGMSSTVLPAEVARKACAEAFRSLEETERLVNEAKGPPVDHVKLEAASAALARAKSSNESCTARVTELRRFVKRS